MWSVSVEPLSLRHSYVQRVFFLILQWAFGVLVWELLTLALQPYADVDPFEMAGYLKEGFRIAQPLNCPDEL